MSGEQVISLDQMMNEFFDHCEEYATKIAMHAQEARELYNAKKESNPQYTQHLAKLAPAIEHDIAYVYQMFPYFISRMRSNQPILGESKGQSVSEIIN